MINVFKKTKISVVIPCYNEEMWIHQTVVLLLACKNVSEIIVVNDGSKDGTISCLQDLKHKIKIISYIKNKGKGYAIAMGIKKAGGGLVVFLDAHHLNINDRHIKEITDPILKGKADVVLGVAFSFSINPFEKYTGFRCYRRTDLIKHIENLEETRFGAEAYLNEMFKDKKTKIIKIKDLIHMVKQHMMGPSGVFSGYLKEGLEVTQTIAKLKGLDTKKLQELFDPKKIKSVKLLKAKLKKIKNRPIVSFIQKYILNYLAVE